MKMIVYGCIVFQVHIADGAVFPVPAALRNGEATTKNYFVPGREERKHKKTNRRSTSSSSSEVSDKGSSSASSSSLGIKESEDYSSRDRSSTEDSEENRGWRKWHRKCEPCPQDMRKKWRDPSIKWICGGYQRARRSFKSECMMQYRNCQDGTMFVKMDDHRCDHKAKGYNGGRHFLYDYRVNLPDDSSKSSSFESSEDSASSSSSE